jgi:hypothetical protein
MDGGRKPGVDVFNGFPASVANVARVAHGK